MRLFDSHCHLEEEAFDEDREEVIRRAVQSGIVGLVTSPIYPEDVPKALSLRGDVVHVSIGLDVAEYGDEDEVRRTIELILEHQDEIVAIGEVGLDYKVARNGPPKEKQKEVFRRFISLARELDKPLVIHSRWAQRPVLRVLDEMGAETVILHAFGGTPADVEFAVERGWYVSVPTNVVRSSNVQKVARATPLERMVLESDSPVLAPNPMERNEPSNITVSVKYLADLKGVDPEDLAEITTENALTAYRLRGS